MLTHALEVAAPTAELRRSAKRCSTLLMEIVHGVEDIEFMSRVLAKWLLLFLALGYPEAGVWRVRMFHRIH